MPTGNLSPFVYWAQNWKNVFLRIDLRNVEDPSLIVEDNHRTLNFSAVGDGSQGRNQYSFSLQLYGDINEATVASLQICSSHIRVALQKQTELGWPSLQASRVQKPAWLKIDFDKWQDLEAEDPEDAKAGDDFLYSSGADSMTREEYEKYEARRLVDSLTKDFSLKGHRDFRYPYMLVYNTAMFLGFFLLTVEMLRGYVAEGEEYFTHAYDDIAPKLFCCQLAQFLEIIHSLLGYVKSGWLAPLLQTSGRGFILFVILANEARLHTKPVVFYLFVVWSLIEVIRYPYYFFATLQTDTLKGLQDFITWLRYTLWIPLYPIGFLCEVLISQGVILLRAIPYFDETRKFSFPLPNSFNVGFEFSNLLLLYMLIAFLPAFFYLMTHMRIQRRKKLGRESYAERFKKAD